MVTLEDIKRIKPIMNLKQLSLEAGLSKGNLSQKVLKNTPLTTEESKAIEEVLLKYGIRIERN